MKIIYKEIKSVGCCYHSGGKRWIELHKDLKNYPKLHQKVLQHEMEHYNENSIVHNWWIDTKTLFDLKTSINMFRFALKNNLWKSYLPIITEKRGNTYLINPMNIIHISIIILLIIISFMI